MAKIIFVQERMQMGMTHPFICKADNGKNYIVKTLKMMPIEQMLAEFIGTMLAIKLRLPTPPIELLHFDDMVYRIIKPEWKRDLTNKSAIGSEYVSSAATAKNTQAQNIQYFSEIEQKSLYMFDRWILNSDRTASQIGTGNINLLFDESQQKILVIDHNLAFDETTKCEEHIFSPKNRIWRLDWVDKQIFTEKAVDILDNFEDIYQSIPDDWFSMEDEEYQRMNNHIGKIKTLLSRITNKHYWDDIE